MLQLNKFWMSKNVQCLTALIGATLFSSTLMASEKWAVYDNQVTDKAKNIAFTHELLVVNDLCAIPDLPLPLEEKQELWADNMDPTLAYGELPKACMPFSYDKDAGLLTLNSVDNDAGLPTLNSVDKDAGLPAQIVINKSLVEDFYNNQPIAQKYLDLYSVEIAEAQQRGSCGQWTHKHKEIRNKQVDVDKSGSDNQGDFQQSWNFSLQGSFNGDLDYKYKKSKWYFGCLPYKARLVKASLVSVNPLTATADASVSYSNSWSKEWSKSVVNLPIWSQTWGIPYVAAVKVDLDLALDIGASLAASVRATLALESAYTITGNVNILCDYADGDGCNDNSVWDTSSDPQPVGAIELEASARVWARIEAILEGKLQLLGSSNTLGYAKAGAEIWVGGNFWGYYGNTCGDGNGDGTNELIYGALVSLNAGTDFWFAIGGQLLSDQVWNYPNTVSLGNYDLLSPSTALTPMISGATEAEFGDTKSYTFSMRPCLPSHFDVSVAVQLSADVDGTSSVVSESEITLSTTGGSQTVEVTFTDGGSGHVNATINEFDTEQTLEVEVANSIIPDAELRFSTVQSIFLKSTGIFVNANIVNDHSAPVSDIEYEVLLSRSDTRYGLGDISLGHCYVKNAQISNGSSVNCSGIFDYPANLSGYYVIYIKVDSHKVYTELDEDNNIYVITSKRLINTSPFQLYP